MLVQFSVENFLSFDEEQVFSMVATNDDQHPKHTVPDVPRKGESVLRGAALYGANAAGKSNLIKAIGFARRLVIAKEPIDAGAIPVRPFGGKENADRPSKFEFIFEAQGVLYNYGFRIDAFRIWEEWLYATPKTQEVKYFERMTHEDGRIEAEFGPSLTGRGKRREQSLESMAQETGANQLFLLKAIQQGIGELQPVLDWFHLSLVVIMPETFEGFLLTKAYNNPDFLIFLSTCLRAAGTGIDSIRLHIESHPFDDKEDFPVYIPGHRENIRESIRQRAQSRDPLITYLGPNTEPRMLTLGHDKQWHLAQFKVKQASGQGGFFELDLSEVSDGTLRLVTLLSSLYEMRHLPGQVVIVDELDRRLHTLLCKWFIQMALDNDEHQQSQLIFTSHDTNLLDLDLLRRDEIWFVEKGKGGASHLYSLVEYKIRPDLRIEKGYLSGRFGAVPSPKDIRNFLENEEAEQDAPTAVVAAAA